MKDQLISFETAKLAKEKGFDIKTAEVYGGQVKPQLEPYNEFRYTAYSDYSYAPTQSLLQKWLRDTKGICVWLTPRIGTNFSGYIQILIGSESTMKTTASYPTYEEALEISLVIALNMIK